MNTPERNKKNIQKMQELGKVYSENADNVNKEEERSASDNATREYPLPTARKFAWVICGAFWLFCLAGFLFGANLQALLPFLMFSLAAAVGLQVPVFWLKGKKFDVVTGIVFSLGCVALGLSIMFSGG